MRKIAIVKMLNYMKQTYGYSSYDDDNYNKAQLVTHVTEFEEISDEDFIALEAALRQKSGLETTYLILEQVDKQHAFIANTVSEYRKLLKKEQEHREKVAAEYKAKQEAAAAERKAKQIAKYKKQIDALAEELNITFDQAQIVFEKLKPAAKKTIAKEVKLK